ncbi:MAG: recombination-associated protein RdgC [Salinisphaera sp.]|nr:recombination-associated protein RdgC [Salinisphaera sp.]
MWIKNLNVFQAENSFAWTPAEIEARLAGALCPPCGSQMLSTEGFVPAIKGDSTMSHAVEGVVYALHQEISRLLPGPVITEAVLIRIEALEAERGRKAGRRERGEIKDQVIFELLPQAFTRPRHTAVLIDLRHHRVWADCASENRAEQVVSALRKALGTLPVAPLDSSLPPETLLTQWLRNPATLPGRLTLGDRCELQGRNDTRATVRCSAVELRSDQILAHLEAGMQVTRLNLCWDDALEFDLTAGLALKRIRPLDRINDSLENLDTEDAVAELQARLALQGGAIRQLMDCLYPAFGVEGENSKAAA